MRKPMPIAVAILTGTSFFQMSSIAESYEISREQCFMAGGIFSESKNNCLINVELTSEVCSEIDPDVLLEDGRCKKRSQDKVVHDKELCAAIGGVVHPEYGCVSE